MAHSAPLFTNQGIAATAMASPSAVQPLVFVGVGLLVAWRLYSRIRRLVGRQPYRPVRSWIQAVLFGVLLVSLLVGTWRHPLASLSELAGVALGLGLALWGLKLTVFEKTDAGCFYTPNLHLGIAQIGVCQLDEEYWYEDTNPQRTFGVRVMDDEGVHEMYEGAKVREYLRDMR